MNVGIAIFLSRPMQVICIADRKVIPRHGYGIKLRPGRSLAAIPAYPHVLASNRPALGVLFGVL